MHENTCIVLGKSIMQADRIDSVRWLF